MILACKKKHAKQTKKSGIGSDPPPSMGKIPTFYRFFSGEPPLKEKTKEAVKWKRLREETEEEMEETAEKNLKPVTNLPRLDQL